jgi:hypothetical protein
MQPVHRRGAEQSDDIDPAFDQGLQDLWIGLRLYNRLCDDALHLRPSSPQGLDKIGGSDFRSWQKHPLTV